jgi:two-component system, LytTR family, sensor kinase
MEPRLILIHLVLKLGVAAAVSSSLVRSKEFKSLLFREERTFRQKVYLVLCMALPIAAGVWIRILVPNFLAGDLSFETALLLGVIGGRWAGSLGGVLMGYARSAARRVGGAALRCTLWFCRRPTPHHGAR